MKRLAPLFLLTVLLAAILAPIALSASASAAAARDKSPAAPIASAITTVTGIAISPLLGTAGYGAYQWATAKDDAAKAKLPWYAQPRFWLPALLIVCLVAAKDSLGTVLPPGAKKPLDVLETIENKFSGLIAAGAVIPFVMDFLSKELVQPGAALGGAAPTGLAMINLAAFDLSWLLNVLTVPFGIAVFAVVWMAAHAINVLILLSPWGAIDAVLKGARTAVLGLLTLTAAIDPAVGAVLSLVLIVIAYFVAGWAFRLTIFGSVFCWDFFTIRRLRFAPQENDNAMFAGPGFPGVPVRSYGRLVQRTAGGLEFVYRPWLFLAPRVAAVPVAAPDMGIGEGFFFSDVVTADDRTIFSLPPRYHGHEATVARAYAMGGGVHPAGLRKTWGQLREMLGGRALQRRPAAV